MATDIPSRVGRVEGVQEEMSNRLDSIQADIRQLRAWLVSAVIIIVAAIVGTGIYFN